RPPESPERAELSGTDGWRYRVAWKPVSGFAAGTVLTGRWLLAVPESGAGQEAAEWCEHGLKAAGAEVVRLAGAAGAASAEHGEVAGVVSLLALDDAPLADGVAPGLAATVALVRALDEAGVRAPLWCLTRGAVSVGTADPVRGLEQTQVWGLGRVAALERPESWGGLLDLPAELDARAWDRTAAALAGGTGEDQLAVRPSGVFAGRLLPAAPPASDAVWEPRGTVLVSDGTTPPAGHLATWLADTSAERVVLLTPVGRAVDPEVLARLGARADVRAVDVTDRAALTELAERLGAEGAPVRAVVHTAGANRLAPLAATDAAELAEALHAKVTGAAHLDA
ncbi:MULTISPECIES: beta-ketoacyl reductase, partial [Streptomyces]|uniref:beta-ketoacyl reductase n=1 Tax=Streptomyces TaxID=1883 RepID=UPI0022494094